MYSIQIHKIVSRLPSIFRTRSFKLNIGEPETSFFIYSNTLCNYLMYFIIVLDKISCSKKERVQVADRSSLQYKSRFEAKTHHNCNCSRGRWIFYSAERFEVQDRLWFRTLRNDLKLVIWENITHRLNKIKSPRSCCWTKNSLDQLVFHWCYPNHPSREMLYYHLCTTMILELCLIVLDRTVWDIE